MDSITKEVLDKMIENNLDFASQMVDVFSSAEVFEKINDILKLCEDKSKDLNRLRTLRTALMDLNDDESKKYIQKLSDAISFFDEAYSMTRLVECGYKGMANGSRKYISIANENKED